MIIDLLDRPIAYHRCFVTLTGSVTAAVLLSQAVYWSRRTGEGNEGWFWKMSSDWEEETGLSRREQDTARGILRGLGFWEEEKRGIPPRLWFRLNLEQLEQLLISEKTSLAESAKLDRRKAPNWTGGKRQTGQAESAKLYQRILQRLQQPPLREVALRFHSLPEPRSGSASPVTSL